MKIGSLFSGYGGLDMAVESVFGATTAWHCEIEEAPSKILAHHWPDVPNLGDITAVDWATVEPVDIICGGSPCQDVSHAGRRAGMREGTRSGLWQSMREGIAVLRPTYVVWENVRGVLSAEADSDLEPCPGCVGDGDDGPVLRALGRVLGDLADLGYDAQWRGLRAADIGAPHGRFRIFVVAADAERDRRRGRAEADRPERSDRRGSRTATAGRGAATADAADVGHERRRTARHGRPRPAHRSGHAPADTRDHKGANQRSDDSLPDRGDGARDQRERDGHAAGRRCATTADTTGDGRDEGRPEPARLVGRPDAAERSHAVTPDADRDGQPRLGRFDPVERDTDGRGRADRPRPEAERTAWGVYEPAIRRWERLTRPAPAPTELAPKGGRRLSPRFEEWMMGLPDGHVCDVPGLTRNDMLKALGNGVVPQQAAAAVQDMLVAAEAAA